MKSFVVLSLVFLLVAAMENESNDGPPRASLDRSDENPAVPSETTLVKELTVPKATEDETDRGSSDLESPKLFNQNLNGSIFGLPARPSLNTSVLPNTLPGGISDSFQQIASAIGSFIGGAPASVEPATGETNPSPLPADNSTSSSSQGPQVKISPLAPSEDKNTDHLKAMETSTVKEEIAGPGSGAGAIGGAFATLGPALIGAIPTLPSSPEPPKPPTPSS